MHGLILKVLRQAIAGSGKKISLELGGKSPVIVYETADLDSAVESVVDAIWFNQGQVCSAGSKLLVQEPVFERFIGKLKTRLGHFRIGTSLDKGYDMGAIVSESQKKTIADYVESAREEGADVFQIPAPEGLFYPPTLITNVNTASKVVMEEIFGPVLVALPFRTAKEAISIANNTMYGLAGSVHSEQLPLALETAKHIKVSLLPGVDSTWIILISLRLARFGSTVTTCLTQLLVLEATSNPDTAEMVERRASLSTSNPNGRKTSDSTTWKSISRPLLLPTKQIDLPLAMVTLMLPLTKRG